jgi:hypothetical protein
MAIKPSLVEFIDFDVKNCLKSKRVKTRPLSVCPIFG